MHLSCQCKKFVSKQTRRALDLGIEHRCGRAERQARGSARHRGVPKSPERFRLFEAARSRLTSLHALYLLSISLVLVTILLVFGMRAFSAVQQAKVRIESDEAYRQIAEKAVAAASENTTALASIQAAMADVRTRLTAIEKVLKEVE